MQWRPLQLNDAEEIIFKLEVVEMPKKQYPKRPSHCHPMGSWFPGCFPPMYQKVKVYEGEKNREPQYSDINPVEVTDSATTEMTRAKDCSGIEVVPGDFAWIGIQIGFLKKSKKRNASNGCESCKRNKSS